MISESLPFKEEIKEISGGRNSKSHVGRWLIQG
jgi:hypothetical protein